MSETKTKILSFAEEVAKRITGDTAGATGVANARKAMAIANSQISENKNNLVDLEEEVVEAKEDLDAIVYPTEKIGKINTYAQDVLNAEASVMEAQEAVQQAKDNIAYWTKFKKDRFIKD